MTELYDYVFAKNPDGLVYDEAVQLFIWIYSTLDVLPVELRAVPMGREYLVETFEQLSFQGLIRSPTSHGSSHWNHIIEDFLSMRVSLDPSFPDRASRYI